jgi:hypothetical protein
LREMSAVGVRHFRSDGCDPAGFQAYRHHRLSLRGALATKQSMRHPPLWIASLRSQ